MATHQKGHICTQGLARKNCNGSRESQPPNQGVVMQGGVIKQEVGTQIARCISRNKPHKNTMNEPWGSHRTAHTIPHEINHQRPQSPKTTCAHGHACAHAYGHLSHASAVTLYLHCCALYLQAQACRRASAAAKPALTYNRGHWQHPPPPGASPPGGPLSCHPPTL